MCISSWGSVRGLCLMSLNFAVQCQDSLHWLKSNLLHQHTIFINSSVISLAAFALLLICLPYILAYKSKSFGQFFALRVVGLTYMQVSHFAYREIADWQMDWQRRRTRSPSGCIEIASVSCWHAWDHCFTHSFMIIAGGVWQLLTCYR